MTNDTIKCIVDSASGCHYKGMVATDHEGREGRVVKVACDDFEDADALFESLGKRAVDMTQDIEDKTPTARITLR